MKKRLAPLGAFLLCCLLLIYPDEAIQAASGAMLLWAKAFFPALFPFFVITPALCCPEALSLYRKMLGRSMEKLLGCPESCAGALAVSLMAGSPAGALALARIKEGLTCAQATRALLLCSSLSPGFCVASLGQAMLASGGAGRLIFRSQLLSLALAGILLRKAFSGRTSPCAPAPSALTQGHPVVLAVHSMAAVCGWMVFFSVLARLISLPLPLLGSALLPFWEITGGSWAVSLSPLPQESKLIFLSFLCGFSGLSVIMQNISHFPEVKKAHFLLGKLLHGLFCALFTGLQLLLPLPGPVPAGKIALVLICLLPLLLYFCLVKNRIAGKRPAFAVEN